MRPPTGGGSPTSIPWSKSYTGKTDYAASRRAHGLVVQRWDAEQINIRHPLQEFCSTENTPKNSFIKKKKKKGQESPPLPDAIYTKLCAETKYSHAERMQRKMVQKGQLPGGSELGAGESRW